MAEEKEKLYSIPLRSVVPKTKRTTKTVKILREYIVRHMKSDNVWIDPKLNDFLWANGTKNPPARIRVKAVKFEDGLVEVSLPELEKEEKKEEETEEEVEEETVAKEKKTGKVKKRKTEKQEVKGKEKEESDKKGKKSRVTKGKKEKTEKSEKEKKIERQEKTKNKKE